MWLLDFGIWQLKRQSSFFPSMHIIVFILQDKLWGGGVIKYAVKVLVCFWWMTCLVICFSHWYCCIYISLCCLAVRWQWVSIVLLAQSKLFSSFFFFQLWVLLTVNIRHPITQRGVNGMIVQRRWVYVSSLLIWLSMFAVIAQLLFFCISEEI